LIVRLPIIPRILLGNSLTPFLDLVLEGSLLPVVSRASHAAAVASVVRVSGRKLEHLTQETP